MNNLLTPETDSENDLQCELAAWELLAEARRERDDSQDEVLKLTFENRSLNQELDKAREALMRIKDLFLDGTDIYADRENMGLIARAALEEINE